MGIKLTVLIQAFQIIFQMIFFIFHQHGGQNSQNTFFKNFPFVLLFIKLKVVATPEKSLKTLEILCEDFLGTDTAICN